MNAYPYIGKDRNTGNITLFTGESEGLVIKNHVYSSGECKGSWAEFGFDNITTEYLASTYGEVESKEHAEFIAKLAEANGRDNFSVIFLDEAKSFVFDVVGDLKFYKANPSELSSVSNLKQITIPLPPECCGIKINNDNGFNFADCKFENNRVNGESEWPKVNDDVLLNEKKGVVKLLPDAQGYYVIAVNGIYTQCKFGELSKPKTPEQELQEHISGLIYRQHRELLDCDATPLLLKMMANDCAEMLTKNHNITKKPQ